MSQEDQHIGNDRDHESDPAHNADAGSDWVDEGGATVEGPATHEDSGHPHPGDGDEGEHAVAFAE